MKKYARALFINILVFTAILASAPRVASAPPFCPGEKLVYRLSWEAVSAGQAVMQVLPFKLVNDRPAWHFRVRVRTNAFAGLFRKVRNQADAYVELDLDRSVAYELQSYGKEDFLLLFSRDGFKTRRIDSSGGETEKKVPQRTLDPWGVFYSFRARPEPGEKGDVLRKAITDGERFTMADLHFGGTLELDVPAGSFEARALYPNLGAINTVFGAEEELTVWASDDDLRIPVRFMGKAAIGRYFAELVEHEIPGPCPAKLKRARSDPDSLPVLRLPITNDEAPGPVQAR